MLGSLTSLTGGGSLQGGASGPAMSGTSGNTTHNMGFTGGGIQLGGHQSPWWLLVVLGLFVLYVVLNKSS